VLLNGRRIANQAYDSGATDLNAIPMAAIDRIEVLRDGASAIYGTDAIGGVINFILRREYSGVEVFGEYQNPEESAESQARRPDRGLGLARQQGFNVMAIDWRDQEAVMAADAAVDRCAARPQPDPR
jgi:iron complex outermembrane receptor protein